MKQQKKKLHPWELIALEAMDMAFTPEGSIKPDLDDAIKNKAIELLYESINDLDAHLYWPYVKLADLIEDPSEKIRLHIRAYRKEENIYSMKYIYKTILNDNPDILDKYLK